MKIYRRVVTFILCFCIIASIVGCKSKYTIDEEKLDNALTQKNTEKKELIIYMPGQKPTGEDEVLEDVINKSGLNIKINFKYFETNQYNYFQRVHQAFASGEKFDAFVCGKSTDDRFNYIKWAREDKLKDLSQLMPKYAPSIYTKLDDRKRNSASVDEKLVLVPNNIDLIGILGIYVDKEIADKYDVKEITNFEEYEVLLDKIKSDGQWIPCGFRNYHPYITDLSFYADAYGYTVLDGQYGIVYKKDDPDMKLLAWEKTDAFKQVSTMLKRWHDRGYIAKNYKEKIATFLEIGDNYKQGVHKRYFNKNASDFNYFIPYLGSKFHRSCASSNIIDSIAFNSKSENVVEGLKLLNWIQSSQENFDLFIYGIKGKDYELKNEKILSINADRSYHHRVITPFINQEFFRLDVGSEAYGNLAEYKEFVEEYTEYDRHEGFYPDFSKVTGESHLRKNIIYMDLFRPIHNGTYNPEKYDAIIQSLEDNTSKVLKELQRQLDEWKSSNK